MSLRKILEALAEFDSSLLANTLDSIDPTPTHEIYMSGDIHSLTPSLGPTVGVASTCKLDTSTPGQKADVDLYWRQLEAMEAMTDPIVWVVEPVGDRPDHECIMGDGMAHTFYSVGCLGVVTSGRVRDLEGMHPIPFAAYARGTCVHHTAMRYVEIDTPVQVGGITVSSGDIIHASNEGVIKIPTASAELLLQWTPKMRGFEHDAHEVLQTNISVADKRERVLDLFRKYGLNDVLDNNHAYYTKSSRSETADLEG